LVLNLESGKTLDVGYFIRMSAYEKPMNIIGYTIAIQNLEKMGVQIKREKIQRLEWK